jgi:hypothetical protein
MLIDAIRPTIMEPRARAVCCQVIWPPRLTAACCAWGGCGTAVGRWAGAVLVLGDAFVDAPGNLTVVQGAFKIRQAFPQAPAPAQIVVSGPDVTGAQVMDAVTALRDRTAATGPVRGPVTATSIGGGQALVVDVQMAGDTATSHDNIQTVRHSTPLVFAVVAVWPWRCCWQASGRS